MGKWGGGEEGKEDKNSPTFLKTNTHISFIYR